MKVLSKSKLISMFCVALFVSTTNAAILWVGGEDLDFQGGDQVCVSTNAAHFRAGYARAALYPCGTNYRIVKASQPLNGGAVTSAWVSGRIKFDFYDNPSRSFGLGNSATNSSLWVGNTSGNGTKVALWKFDGSTWTQIASETGASITTSSVMKYDMQITNYGASANVKIFVNGSSNAVIDYTGDVTGGGAVNLDRVFLSGFQGGAFGTFTSEVMAADVDTRLLSVVTLAPNAAGTTNEWTGAHTDVNEISSNDTTLVSSATSGQNFQCNVNDLPSGAFSVYGVKVAARAAKSSGGIGGIAPGVYTNSSVSVPSAGSLIGAFTTVEAYFQTNPVTTNPWTPTEINSLQLNLQSAP